MSLPIIGNTEVLAAITNLGTPRFKKGIETTIVFPIYDNQGGLVTGAAALDSEVSKDGASFTDCTNEAAEIGTSGMYTLTITATEMNADIITIITKTSTTNAKTTPTVIYTV